MAYQHYRYITKVVFLILLISGSVSFLASCKFPSTHLLAEPTNGYPHIYNHAQEYFAVVLFPGSSNN